MADNVKGKAVKSALDRYEHDYKNKFNKHLKHQKRTNAKLGLPHDYGMKGASPIK